MEQNSESQGLIDHLSVEKIPKTLLQAIYHEVTGKTETLSKTLSGNVVVRIDDLIRLFDMVRNQMEHYKVVFAPVSNVIVKYNNEKSMNYSSWERFEAIEINDVDVVSEIIIRIEFGIHLPSTPQPQRFILNISIDSSLPILIGKKQGSFSPESFGFFFVTRQPWPTVRISIDFVDFLVAKIFSNVVEEWFKGLEKTPESVLNEKLFRNFSNIQSIYGQFGRIGMAIFLMSYILFSSFPLELEEIVLVSAFGMLLWAAFIIMQSIVLRNALKKITSGIIPSVILVTNGDKRSYNEINSNKNQPIKTLINVIASILFGISINLASSYIFASLQ